MTTWIPVFEGGHVAHVRGSLIGVPPRTVDARAVGHQQLRLPSGELAVAALLSSPQECDATMPMLLRAPRELELLAATDRGAALWAAAQWKHLAMRATSATGDFTRIDPCVLALVHAPEGVALLHRHGAAGDRWGAVAGYVEPGESAEQAVAREVAEETGFTVVSTVYAGSESWPPSGSLMLGFSVTVAEPFGAALVLDAAEHDRGAWFPRHQVAAARRTGTATVDGRPLALPDTPGLAQILVDRYIADAGTPGPPAYGAGHSLRG
ncbi:NAD(+) diphosphatase [Tsukamurella strandjordii]|uniref:NAD(+) diphosphatase n=1 Tax=Tsukamurella strandjordii TaxID=147577 RepID=UPI0031D020B0